MTYGEAVDYIISQMTRTDVSLTSDTQTQLKRAIEHYSAYRFNFNESKWTLSTSSSLADYAIPTDLMEVDSFIVTAGGTKYPLFPESYDVVDGMDEGNSFGRPYCYAVFAENFRLFLVPDQVYPIVISGQKRLATLSASTDTNAWLDTALDLVCNRAIATLELIRFKDSEAAQRARVLEESAFERLQLQSSRYSSTGRIQPAE